MKSVIFLSLQKENNLCRCLALLISVFFFKEYMADQYYVISVSPELEINDIEGAEYGRN